MYEELLVGPEKSCVEEIIPVTEDTKLREELIGVHAVNPLTHHNSSQRNYMFSSHFSQALVLPEGEPHILQSGVDNRLAKYTFGAEVEKRCRVLAVIKKYESYDPEYVDVCTEQFVLVHTMDNELDVITVSNHHTGFHQTSGFEYIWNPKLDTLRKGNILEEGEKLSYSPAIANGGYGFGVNVNTAMMTHPDVAEDGVIISESFSKKFRHHVYEKIVVNFGTESFPLNLYGDENNYKAFPEIGEKVNEHGVLIALRSFKDLNLNKTGETDFTPGLLGVKSTMEFNPEFDECFYVRGPGKDVDIGNGRTEPSGVVVDIEVFKNDKKIPKLKTGADEYVEKYHKSYEKFGRDFLEAYDNAIDELRGTDYKISPRLHQKVVQLGLINYEYNVNRLKNDPKYSQLYKKMVGSNLPGKISTSYKSEKLDSYRVEITVRYTVVLTRGHKVTDFNGGKGVIVAVKPDHMMPFNSHCRADMVVDSSSSIGRMNTARLYQPYFCLASRNVQANLRKMLGNRKFKELNENEIEEMFRYLMGFLGKFATPQFHAYAKATFEEKIMILKECVEKEVYIMFKITNEKKAYQIQQDIKHSEYKPPLERLTIPVEKENGEVEYVVTKDPIYIGPLYTILLNKSADKMSFNSSPELNIFNFPNTVSSSMKHRRPYRNSPVKAISETENRLYAVTGGRQGIVELKDRANSPDTHIAIYRNLLDAEIPTNIDDVVDRKNNPYGKDAGIRLVKSTANMMGLDFEYVK